MWYARVDVQNQQFVIEDHNGEVIAIRTMPTTIFPNPGREALLSKDDNREAWDKVWDLVNAANRINK
jgi:hypothetical protein